MITALTAVMAIAIGLPLLAWWAGGRRFWSRLRPGAEPNPWGDTMRRFGLTPQETAQVESAVNWGRRLDDARLRPAAVAWAQSVIDRIEARRRGHSPWRRVAVVSTCYAALGALFAWETVHTGRFPWNGLVWWLLWPAGLIWLARAPYRARQLNSEPDRADTQAPSRTDDGGPAR
jgi:hypothetical protein